jgi:predicted HicB family RNase H-like nuclease
MEGMPMARKRTERKKMPATAEPKTKPVRLDLQPDAHRLLRLVAASEGMSMAAYARDVVERHVREEAERRGFHKR